jgi:hypothetical protein
VIEVNEKLKQNLEIKVQLEQDLIKAQEIIKQNSYFESESN